MTTENTGEGQLNITGQTDTVDLGVTQLAHAQFAFLEPMVMNRDMITTAITQLTGIEERLSANIDAYVTDNGGEEVVNAEIRDNQHGKLPLARFKLELVRTTLVRFKEQLAKGEKAVDDFVKINPEE